MSTFESIFNEHTASFFLCLLSAIVIIAVWLVIKQNQKILEENTRPYLVLSFQSSHNTNTENKSGYFVLKNYGKTSGTITRFLYPAELKNTTLYQSVRGINLAPGQTLVLPCPDSTVFSDTFEFKIIYHATALEKNYSDRFSFRTAMLCSMQTDTTKEESQCLKK